MIHVRDGEGRLVRRGMVMKWDYRTIAQSDARVSAETCIASRSDALRANRYATWRWGYFGIGPSRARCFQLIMKPCLQLGIETSTRLVPRPVLRPWCSASRSQSAFR